MSDDDLHIKPDAVKTTGHQLTDLAASGRTATDTYFDAQAAAAAANEGFASGPKAVAYASKLHGEMNGFITDLQICAAGIVAGAQSFSTTIRRRRPASTAWSPP